MDAWMDDPLAWMTLGLAGSAALILIWYLVRRPPLDAATKVILLIGIAVLPIGAAASGNIRGFAVSQQREFCGSCHVMTPYTSDSGDPDSESLAAVHGRNHWFGEKNCYTCHSDYGMFGTVVTKLSGLRHVYEYYTKYHAIPKEQALKEIRLYKPFANTPCLQCHSTRPAFWNGVPDHLGAAEDLRAGKIGCAGSGCHGPVHPFSKEVEKP
jgi:nitrate/TMAO reductase-like tetraheme cytochrome c subunit